MSTPAELAQQALDFYHATAVSRPQWAKDVAKGIYNPPDGSKKSGLVDTEEFLAGT